MRRDIFEVSEDGMPVEDLASMLAVDPSEVVKTLFMKGIMVQVNQVRGHWVDLHYWEVCFKYYCRDQFTAPTVSSTAHCCMYTLRVLHLEGDLSALGQHRMCTQARLCWKVSLGTSYIEDGRSRQS